MKGFKRLAAVVGVLFLIIMAVNFKYVDRVWPKWLGGTTQEYYGNIELWHINDDFSQRIPYDSMLKKYEKQNFGIFVNVTYLSPEEAREKINSGERPDMVTYSRNIFEEPEKELEKLEELDTPLEDRGKAGRKQLAYTLYYDTYTLIINDELAANTEEDIPSVMEPSYIANIFAGLNFGEGVVPIGFTRYGGALNMLDAVNDGQVEIYYNQVSMKDFEEGKAAAVVCSTLELDKYSGELPSYSEYSFSGFTDRGRFLSILKSDNRDKLDCCKYIAEMLMSERYQKQISEYAFSPEYGYQGGLPEGDVRLVRVFENTLDKEKTAEMLAFDRNTLLEQITEMCE